MRALASAAITAMLFVGGTIYAIAQTTSPVPGAQPGTKKPGEELPKKGEGSGSAPIGPPAATPSRPNPTPGTPTTPGAPTEAQKQLDTPSSGGASK
jgi:hypothetical protein